MIKIRKDNIVYKIDKRYVDNYLRKGFEIIETPKIVEEVTTEVELRAVKDVGKMTKIELIELANTMGLTLTGKEKINDLRRLLR